MNTLFVVCASLGGTILVLQFLMTLLGLGGHSMGFDHDVGHDFGGDHDFGGGDHDLGSDGHGGDTGAHDGADGHSHDGARPAAAAHHGSSWLFGVISFRTVIAAMAFFGLAGLATQATGAPDVTTLSVALAAGFAAMYGVYAMMRAMNSLRAEGTIRIHRAVGQQGSVYLRVPPHNSGTGKIQINLQNRTMEYLASTSGEEIPTGATVVVTEVLGSDTVQVQAVGELKA